MASKVVITLTLEQAQALWVAAAQVMEFEVEVLQVLSDADAREAGYNAYEILGAACAEAQCKENADREVGTLRADT